MDQTNGDLSAAVAALVERAQNATWNGHEEADRVATEVTAQLVAMSAVDHAGDGPLVIVRVGPADGGYFVGPFTPTEADAWREENVTIPGMQWALVPLLPPAARPAGADLYPPAGR